VGQILQALVLAACGVVLLASVWSAMSFLAFWLQSVNPSGAIYLNLGEAGRYPLVFFPAVVRTFLTFLVAAPVVFLTLFLVDSPVSKLVFPEQAEAKTVAVDSRTPVVVVVFDEFPTISLMDRRQHVDAARFPNFAALQGRNGSAVRRRCTRTRSKPCRRFSTGQQPKQGALPIFADHLRTSSPFGRSYRLNVVEALTHLCPPKLCKKKTRATQQLGADDSDETGSLASDTGIVYLHLLLPNPYVSHVPPISNTWGNFGGDERAEVKAPEYCGRNICRLASQITAERKPALYFVHSLLPHVPWLYLPSGKRYGGDVRVVPGAPNGTWGKDDWLAKQAQQRFFLQLGYTDHALGLILRRLRATRLYDRSLIVVTADHGVSFRPGTPRRNITSGNLVDIAFMPLFVKLPGQKRGRIDDSFAQTIDILPTIAAALTHLSLARRRQTADRSQAAPGRNGQRAGLRAGSPCSPISTRCSRDADRRSRSRSTRSARGRSTASIASVQTSSCSGEASARST
jgi:hypothetical protein